MTIAPEELIEYLHEASQPCVEQSLGNTNDPDFHDTRRDVYSDANMQAVFAEIEHLSPSYDGSSGSVMHSLWWFVRAGVQSS